MEIDLKEYTYINSNELKITRKINGSENVLKKINNIDFIDKFILVVDFPNLGGGTGFFINTIISKYKKNVNFLIVRNINENIKFNINEEYELDYNFSEIKANHFINVVKHKIIKIFVNHTLYFQPNFILNLFNLDKEVVTITHDYYTIYEKYNPYYREMITTKRSPIDVNLYNFIITQNVNNLPIFKKYLNSTKKIIISELPDFKKSLNKIITQNKECVLAIIGSISEHKGDKIVQDIITHYKNSSNVKIVILGQIFNMRYYKNQYIYNTIDDINNLLLTHKPNAIIETSIWPETYSYTLSLAKITQLPIFYLNKPFHSVIKNRLNNYNAYPFNSINELKNLLKHKQNFFYTIEPKIYYNKFWDSYFLSNKNQTNNSETETETETEIETETETETEIETHDLKIKKYRFKYDIKPYCVYFPQFHTFDENDKNYYKGFSDITNLKLLKDKYNKDIDIESPLLSYFDINKITQYNLLDCNIIQKQIDLLKKYDLPGFAMYYYWFSTNEITNKNMIMERVIDSFFSNKVKIYDKKIFFIWANEDWSNNPAFGATNGLIINDYNDENLKKNASNLMTYFKHETYLKIKNKPVLLIHHPFYIKHNEINAFKTFLNNECKENGFDGVHLILNKMNNKNEYNNECNNDFDNECNNEYNNKYPRYIFHPNYKSFDAKCIKRDIVNGIETNLLDYKKYTNNLAIMPNNIQSLFFNFDNRPRLFKPDRLDKATICSNADVDAQCEFIVRIVESYKNANNDINKILLINSWNEWGERMAIEPSDERGYYYLDLISKYLSE